LHHKILRKTNGEGDFASKGKWSQQKQWRRGAAGAAANAAGRAQSRRPAADGAQQQHQTVTFEKRLSRIFDDHYNNNLTVPLHRVCIFGYVIRYNPYIFI